MKLLMQLRGHRNKMTTKKEGKKEWVDLNKIWEYRGTLGLEYGKQFGIRGGERE